MISSKKNWDPHLLYSVPLSHRPSVSPVFVQWPRKLVLRYILPLLSEANICSWRGLWTPELCRWLNRLHFAGRYKAVRHSLNYKQIISNICLCWYNSMGVWHLGNATAGIRYKICLNYESKRQINADKFM